MPRSGPKYVTATDIYKFIACPHWPYYDWHATPAEKKLKRRPTDGEVKRREDGVAHERETVAELFPGQAPFQAPASGDMETDSLRTLDLMRQGTPAIYQGTLVAGRRAGRPDLLLRREGESVFGTWHYVPADIKSTREIEKYQKFQLAFYADLLSAVQGRKPGVAMVFNAEKECLEFDPEDIEGEFADLMARLEASVFDGVKPASVLRKDCFDTGVWGKLCERTAKQADDIALLYNVSVQKLEALRNLGVHTVRDAAALDPGMLAGQGKGLTEHALETIKLQAQSLRDRSVIIRKPVALPEAELEVHFDIESSPPHRIDYLYGCLLRRPGRTDEYVSFVSRDEGEEAEGEMWRQFLDWLSALPLDLVVYHYSPYELGRLSIMANRHGQSHWLDHFRSKMVDLAEFSKHNVTFPLNFYGLKHVAKFLGFRWRGHEVTSGGESIDQFAKYLATKDEKVLRSIIDYNEDDVRATAHFKDWLDRYARTVKEYPMPYPWEGKAGLVNEEPG